MNFYNHRTLTVGDIETHYLEAGEGPHLVLFHGGEYGASAETSWKFNMESLGKYFHVIAPDLLGYGKTDKIYSFSDPAGFRIKHLSRFLKSVGVEKGYFVGNSAGGGLVLRAAVMDPPPFPIEKMVTVCGNAGLFKTEAQSRLQNYSFSLESMEEIMGLLFHDRESLSKELIQERFEVSLIPGSWETLSAARLKRPGYTSTPFSDTFVKQLASVRVPLLIMSCAHDLLNPKGWDNQLQNMIPGSKIHHFLSSAHEPQIEEAEEFARALREFLTEQT